MSSKDHNNYCPYCSEAIATEANFCPHCDEKIAANSPIPSRTAFFNEIKFIFSDRFEVLQETNTNGIFIIYKAFIRQNYEPVFLKIINPYLITDKNQVEQFIRENEITEQLQHKNIFPILEFGYFQEIPYAVYPYFDGEDLSNKLCKKQTLNEINCHNIIFQLGDTLYYAHNEGVIHGHLTSKHIYISRDGQIYLNGFLFRDTEIFATNNRSLIVTPYSSPEQLAGTKIDYSTDIYSMTLILYECLNGNLPELLKNPLKQKRFFEEKEPYELLGKKELVEYEALFRKGLAKQKQKRYESVNTFLENLKKIEQNKVKNPTSSGKLINLGLNNAKPGILNIELLKVPGGVFKMGSSWWDSILKRVGFNERPKHTVSVNGFFMSKYEITFKQFDHFCEAMGYEKPEDMGWGRDDRPVINITWYDAVEFCNWLSIQSNLEPCYVIDKGSNDSRNKNKEDYLKWKVICDFSKNGFRLPTEAEWEYAARSGSKSFSEHSQKLKNVAWYRKNSNFKTHPVGQKRPNTFGLYDMIGNVWEWCWDWYDSKYYRHSPPQNPLGPSSGLYRVIRGGSWMSQAWYLRFGTRGLGTPSFKDCDLGFRITRSA